MPIIAMKWPAALSFCADIIVCSIAKDKKVYFNAKTHVMYRLVATVFVLE
jgi:hypothetical protein